MLLPSRPIRNSPPRSTNKKPSFKDHTDGWFDQLGIGYISLHPRLTLGIYGSTSFTFGNPVFYARPYVSLRGIPALRYQRDNLAEIEIELRWQCFWSAPEEWCTLA